MKHGGWRRAALSCRGVKEPSEEKGLENTRRVRGMQRGCQTPRWGVQNGAVPEQGMGFGCSAALEPWVPLPAPLGTGGWRGDSSWHGHCRLCRCPLMSPGMAQADVCLHREEDAHALCCTGSGGAQIALHVPKELAPPQHACFALGTQRGGRRAGTHGEMGKGWGLPGCPQGIEAPRGCRAAGGRVRVLGDAGCGARLPAQPHCSAEGGNGPRTASSIPQGSAAVKRKLFYPGG